MATNPKPESEDITLLLQQWRAEDPNAEAKLFELLMPNLRRIAAQRLRAMKAGHSLQRTELVNEAFIRLCKAKGIDWQSRGHFFAIASLMMRRILIDHIRRHRNMKFVPLSEVSEGLLGKYTSLKRELIIDEQLNELAKVSKRQCEVVQLKHYMGLTDEEAAGALGLKLHTFQREWHRARKWLFQRLNDKR